MSTDKRNIIGIKSYGNEQILNLFNVNERNWLSGRFIPMVLVLFGITLMTTLDSYSPMVFGQSASQPQNLSFTYYTNWGSVGEEDGQFDGQNDVDYFNGKVYVPDYANHRIQIFDPEGNFLSKFGEGGEGDGQFHKASALSMDSEGNIYVADQFNYRIQKFDNNGTFLAKWGSEGAGDGQFLHPHVPANDATGKLFVTDRDHPSVQVFSTDGEFLYRWGSEGEGDSQLSNPESSIVDSSGNVYIADYGNDRIQKFSNDGTYLSQWGTKGTENGQFQGPSGLSIDSNDNIYVTDKNNNRVQVFTKDGQYITQFGGGADAGEGQLLDPEGVGVDKESGTVYVADTGNTRIVVFKPN